jgi:predicted acyl esterase
MKVVVGPFLHSMPEDSNCDSGLGFDGKAEMVRWFSHWLKDDNQYSDIVDEPDITLFIRTSLTTGTYRYEPQWPIARQQIRRMFMSKEQKLVQQIPVSSSTTTIHEESGNKIDVDTLEYRSWIGFEAGVWWGSFTDDQRSFDDHCLIYDSDSLNETIEIVGFVQVSLQVMKPIQKVYLSFI